MGESWEPDKHTWYFTPEVVGMEIVLEGFNDEAEIEFIPDDDEWIWEYQDG